jgi:hypothetical protein
MDEATRNRLSDIQARYAHTLMEKPNVVGVGIGLVRIEGEVTAEPALIVMVTKKIPDAELAPDDTIPKSIEGVRVDVQETGAFEAQ